MEKLAERCLCSLYYVYLRLLERTVRLEYELPDKWEDGRIVGFWHEDSFIMNLLLKKLSREQEAAVIVTADKRGDYIEEIIRRCHGSTIRLSDGFGARTFLKDVVRQAQNPWLNIAAAMDGPLGPRRVPKTLPFYLSEKGEKEFASVHVRYSRALGLTNRWDHYRIPLPFTRIQITVENHGIMRKNQISEFKTYPLPDNCSIIINDCAGMSGSHRMKSRTGVWRRWRQTVF